MVILSVGESKPKKWKPFAWAIMLVEGSDHSHSFVSWKDEKIGIRKVAEARGGGGRIISNIKFKEDNEVVRIYQYEVTEEKLNELEAWLWTNMRPYGFKHILGLFFMRVGNWAARVLGLNIKFKNPYKDGEFSLICVELSARSIVKATDMNLGDVEDYSINEMHAINEKLGNRLPQEQIDRINGKY